MSIPISTVVNVTVAIPPSYPSGAGFSTLLVLGKGTNLPLSVRAQTFTSVQQVGQVFSSTQEEYKASESFFSQNPRPSSMVIGRSVIAPSSGELYGSTNYDAVIAHWQALANTEVLHLTVDGTPVTLTGMDFAAVANLNGVAAVIDEALLAPQRGAGTLAAAITDTDTTIPLEVASTAQSGDTLKIDSEFMTVMDATDLKNLVVTRAAKGSFAASHAPGSIVYIGVSGVMTANCTFTGSVFLITSGSTGATSNVSVTAASKLSGMLGFDAGSISTPGIAAAETPATSLDACSAVSTFYGVVLTKEFTDADALLAAAWTEANTKLFGHASGDQNCKSSTSTDDFVAICQSNMYSRTADAYNDPQGLSDYLMVSALARELAVDFSQPNSSITMMFKVCPGVTPSNINTNDKIVLDSKNANYYAVFGAVPMFAKGVCASGLYIDLRHGLDFMGQHLGDAAFLGLYGAPKIPQTDKGVTYLTGLLEIGMQDMVNCGFIAPGVWQGTGIGGVVNTGEFLTKGFKVVAATIASQSQADRLARKAPPITIVCKSAGAFHEVDIYIQFEQ